MRTFTPFAATLAVAVLCLNLGCDAKVTVETGGGGGEPGASSQTGGSQAAAESGSQPASGGEGFSLEIPGLGVDVKAKDGKVDVTAPGVKVNRDPATGVSVQAPGTDVKVEGTNVKVKAPGTDVDVEVR